MYVFIYDGIFCYINFVKENPTTCSVKLQKIQLIHFLTNDASLLYT